MSEFQAAVLWKRQYRAADNLLSDYDLDALQEVVRRFVAWAVPIFRAMADAFRTFIESCVNLFASVFSGITYAQVLRMGVLEDRRAAGVLRYEAWRDRWRSWVEDREYKHRPQIVMEEKQC